MMAVVFLSLCAIWCRFWIISWIPSLKKEKQYLSSPFFHHFLNFIDKCISSLEMNSIVITFLKNLENRTRLDHDAFWYWIYYRIAKALNSSSASIGDIISTTERLKQELEITTQRQEIVSCFVRDYQISNEEVEVQFYIFNASFINGIMNFGLNDVNVTNTFFTPWHIHR